MMITIEELIKDYEKKLCEIYARANTKSKRKRIVNELFAFSHICYEHFGKEKTYEWENDINMILLANSYMVPFTKNITKNKEVYNSMFTSTMNTIVDSGYSVYDYFGKNYMRITEKELQELLFDFLGSYDDELLKEYKKKLENAEIFYTDLYESNGITYPMPNLSKNLIFYTTRIQDYNSIETASVLVHELGHDYEINKLYNVGKTNYMDTVLGKPYYEISSRFLEYTFLNYLIENNIYREDAKKCLHVYIYDLLYRAYSVTLLYKMDRITVTELGDVVIEDDSVSDFAHEIQNKINSYAFPADKGDVIKYKNAFIYGIGDLFSLYLYDNYKQDPKNFKKEFLNALLASPYVDDISPFERVGITPEILIKEDTLKKVLKNSR